MPGQLTSYRVFIASPGGLEKERRAFRDVFHEFNEDVGNPQGLHFVPVGWEFVPAGQGRPQEIINQEVEMCDYLVLVLHNRWGSPPVGPDESVGDVPTSGTHEEFLVAEKCCDSVDKPMKEVVPLFKAVDPDQLADPGKQLRQVLDFKKCLQDARSHLYREFSDDIEEFKREIRRQLNKWSRGIRDVEASEIQEPSIPPTEVSYVNPPVDPNSELNSNVVSEAERLAGEGKLVEAEERFASAVVGRADLNAINRFGHFLSRLGRLSQAQITYERVLELATDDGWKAIALGNLGLNEWTRGNLDAAEDYHKRSLAIEESLGRKEGMASDLGNLGLIEQMRGNLDAAEEYLMRSLAIDKSLGRKEGMAIQLGNLGLIEQTRGNLDAAEDYHKRSLAIEESLGRKEGMAIQLGNLGLIEETRGNLDAAEDCHKRSLAINESLGRKVGMANQLGNLGLIEQTRGNLNVAEEYLKRSLAINESLGRKEGMAIQLANLGSIERERGNYDSAQSYRIRSIDLYRQIGMPHMVEKVQGWLDDLPDE
ncbi:MAG: DUF4062 domain-containing protein [Phycisphaera sp.]|nr:MAG: DUF4062 domain-containing protein [Phycisphaera sp.]